MAAELPSVDVIYMCVCGLVGNVLNRMRMLLFVIVMIYVYIIVIYVRNLKSAIYTPYIRSMIYI